jgi:transglutaminase-like putative cysteine protease
MRIRISHSIAYAYAEPARHITQILRLTPRDHDGQHVMSWRIEPTVDGRLRAAQDAFGNIVHSFSADGPIAEMAIKVEGLIETSDLAGLLRGTAERVPVDVFLRDTLLTGPDEALRSFADDAAGEAGTPLSQMHALMEGIAQDIAHIFIACARHLGIPARYVSGYVAQSERLRHANGAHAWAEIHLDDYGWIGFDAANGLCPTDTHVRVATGLDFAGAAPVRGARAGGDGEALAIRISAREDGARLADQ